MDAAKREKEIRKITVWGAFVNILLSVLKLLAGVLGHSAAMLADGLHSLSDLFSDAIVLVFSRISSKGKDRDHSFGHGKFETFATLVVSLVLLATGAGLMKSGICSIIDILDGKPYARPGYLALAAAVVSIAVKEILYRITVAAGRAAGSPMVVANAWHHRSDAFSSVGSLVGIAGAMFLGSRWIILDPLASCCISIVIIVVAVRMALPSVSELLDASLPEDVEAEIRAAVNAVPGVRNVHCLKTRRNGVSDIIDAHILVDPSISIVKAHDISTSVEKALAARFGSETQVSIHVEPDVKSERMED